MTQHSLAHIDMRTDMLRLVLFHLDQKLGLTWLVPAITEICNL